MKTIKVISEKLLAVAAASLCVASLGHARPALTANQLQPYPQNPFYWQYKGQPTLFFGGSDNDNLFQWTGSQLTNQLNLLSNSGGNQVRCSLSFRDDGDEQPFLEISPGTYDLDQWNPAFWNRLTNLFTQARNRDILVQIELFDRFDYSRSNWDTNAYNPKNNINYSYGQSGFESTYTGHPNTRTQHFFFTVPGIKLDSNDPDTNTVVLPYQEAFVSRVLETVKNFDNVIICIDNETNMFNPWSIYWSDYIRDEENRLNRRFMLTQMWDNWDILNGIHNRTFGSPERYDFVEISQNNMQVGQTNWQNFQTRRSQLVSEGARPMNSTKVYGSDILENSSSLYNGRDDDNAIGNFWRNLLGGAATSRFHRPDFGIALGTKAQTQIGVAEEWLNHHDIFNAEPDSNYSKLGSRSNNEAYLSFENNKSWTLYFPANGSVNLNTGTSGSGTLRWANLQSGAWTSSSVSISSNMTISTPGSGKWLAVLTKGGSSGGDTNPTITTNSLPSGQVGSSYSASLQSSSGDAPFTWNIQSGSLPAGLFLNANNGSISGTPNSAGSSSFTVRIQDSDGDTATKSLSISVSAPPPPPGDVDYTDNFSNNNISDWTFTGGTWSASGGEVLSTENFGGNNNDAILYYNAGSNWSDYTLTFDMSTVGDNDSMGAVVYYQDVNNHLGFFATADFDGGPRWALFQVINGNRTILQSVNQGYSSGQAFSVTVSVENGGQITVNNGAGVNLSRPVPSALSSGTIGFYTEYNDGARFDNVTVSSEGGQADLTPTITTTSLPGGQENSAYSATLQADSGDGSLSWNISSGSLPAGLSLSSSGVISGTPTTAGTSNFTARVQDADGDAATRSLSIVIAPDGGGTGATTTLEPEGLTASSSQTTTTYNDGGASGGQWLFVDGVGVGSAVEFTVNAAPDTYNVSYTYKRQGSRGIIQLKVNGANVGSAIDQRNGSGFVTTPVLGTVTLNASNTFRFEAVGTNGSDYNIAVDAIILESTGGGGGGDGDLGPEYEAEAYDTATSVVGPWVEITDASASGGKYMEVPENSVGNTGLNPAPATGYLDFEFELDSAGPVYFWIHGQAPAVNGYGGDSIHIDVLGDGIGPNLWNNIFLASEHGTWVWKEWTNNKPASLGAGFHTLRIYYREDGFKLDQIAISTDANYSPN